MVTQREPQDEGRPAPRRRTLAFGPFRFDPARAVLSRNGQEMELAPRALSVLRHLLERPGEVISKDSLLDAAWNGTAVGDDSLSEAIRVIRRALGDDPQNPTYIQTVHRRGYRFVARVTVEKDGDLARSTARSRRAVLAVAGVALIALLTSSGWWILDPFRPEASLSFDERDWILITSFENRTGEPELDGTLESALEQELRSSRFVNVVPRPRVEDVLRLMQRSEDTRLDADLGREICLRDGEIQAMLGGRIEKLGSTYRLSLDVVEPRDGSTVDSSSQEAATKKELWPAIRRASSWVRETLGEELQEIDESVEKLERVTTRSFKALKLYSDAVNLVHRGKRGSAGELLREALSLDPQFGSAYTLMAWVMVGAHRDEAAIRHAELGVRYSESLPARERYFALGTYYGMTGEFEKEIDAYTALIEAAPDHYWGWSNLAFSHRTRGNGQQAAEHYVAAARLRPNKFGPQMVAGASLVIEALDTHRAQTYIERAKDLYSQDPARERPANRLWLELYPAFEHWNRGDVRAALAVVDAVAPSLNQKGGKEQDALATGLGLAYLTFGKLEKAETIFERVVRDVDRTFCLARLALVRRDRRALHENLLVNAEDPVNSFTFAAFLLAREGFHREATQMVSEGYPHRPHVTLPIEGMGKIVQGDSEAGAALLHQSIALNRVTGYPLFFALSETLAGVLLQRGDAKRAIQVLEIASGEKKRAYPWGARRGGMSGYAWLAVQERLAELYREQGREEEARAIESELRHYLEFADPDHPILAQLPPQESEVASLEMP